MHVLPRVREIEERYRDTLTVIGVHAGKFTAEHQTERVRRACDRLGVTHPVANDRHFRTWRAYGVRAWPTIALIDPAGRLVAMTAGEFDPGAMDALIAEEHERARASITPGIPDLGEDPRRPLPPDGPLRYPARAIEGPGGHLFVADTGNRRVLEIEFEGERGRVRAVHAPAAGFVEPVGLARADDGTLYVADRAGHTVWALGGGGEWRVVAGTGAVATGRIATGRADAIPLRSPWALALQRSRLVISMAGSHQIHEYDPATGALALMAGSGAEEVFDGPASRAALAQPTGLAVAGDALAFADCESSAVRMLEAGRVRTVVGSGLFDWGDTDGRGDEARLQHTQDLTWHDGTLFAADTYNDCIKQIDPLTRECRSLPGDAGRGGALLEPGGIAAGTGALLVADTGNHRIVRVTTDGRVVPLTIEE